MTTENVNTRNDYVGNDVTKNFTFTFKIDNKNEILVIVNDVVKTVDVDYTVTGVGVETGGSITFTNAPALNEEINLILRAPFTQLLDLFTTGNFDPASVESALDKLCRMVLSVFAIFGQPVSGKFVKWAPTLKHLETADAPTTTGAAEVGYTPADLTDWRNDADPGAVSDALDQLADRTEALEGANQITPQTSYLISGGSIIWQSAYNFIVTAAQYLILGLSHASPQTTITLSAAHATLDRIDVIAVDVNNQVVVIQGTAAAQPSEPDINPSTQLKLGFILVPANTTQPPGITSLTIYAENTGDPPEWNTSTSGTGFNNNSTASPRTGTKSIEGTSTAANAYTQLAKGSGTINLGDYGYLLLYIKSKASWAGSRQLRVYLLNAGVQEGNPVSIVKLGGAYGFDSSITAIYQAIAIPLSHFAAGNVPINQVRILATGDIGFYIDDVSFQQGSITQSGGSTTATGTSYTPADPARWIDPDPTNVAAALDQLAGQRNLVNITQATLAGALVLTYSSTMYQALNPNGANRDVTFPVGIKGLAFYIINTGAAGDLVLKDSGGVQRGTVSSGQAASCIYDGSAWRIVVGNLS